MRYFLLMIAVVALVGCGEPAEEKIAKAEAAAEAKDEDWEAMVETNIRFVTEKPTGELTKADLEKVTILILNGHQLTNVKGLEKLTKLRELHLKENPDLTKAQIDALQKALPKCKIRHDFE